jgi:hypothetical protein
MIATITSTPLPTDLQRWPILHRNALAAPNTVGRLDATVEYAHRVKRRLSRQAREVPSQGLAGDAVATAGAALGNGAG